MGGPVEHLDVAGTPVRLSNPDKVYFPALGAAGGTKRHLVEYYLEVVTAPTGATGGNPAAAAPTSPVGPIVRALADRPDELRIDLDPQPGTGFAEARAVALDVVRPLLDELGYTGFPKTSGGRGVHVYLRIQPRWDFTGVRRAAIAFAREVERRAGGRVTTAWWKEERGRTVFVDYNQNARDRTVASAYSVRRTPRATVSTPLTWAELVDADPDELTLATVPGLLARRRDPMAGLDDVAHDLAPLLDLADRDEAGGLSELPYPPNYPKMPGEPPRVQPSRARRG